MFRKSGVSVIKVLSGAPSTPIMRIPEMAAGLLVLPAGFTGVGSASIWIGSLEVGVWQLYDTDGATPITINLQPDMAIIMPPEAMIGTSVQIAFATNVTRDETIYFVHKS